MATALLSPAVKRLLEQLKTIAGRAEAQLVSAPAVLADELSALAQQIHALPAGIPAEALTDEHLEKITELVHAIELFAETAAVATDAGPGPSSEKEEAAAQPLSKKQKKG